MNILHLTPYYAPAYAFGGVVRAVEGLAQTLAERGHTVTVLTTDALDPQTRSPGPADEVRGGVRVLRVPNLLRRGTLNLSTPRGVGRVARGLLENADVIHCHEFRTVENLLVAPIAQRIGKPLLLSPHGTLTLNTGRGAVKQGWDRLFSRKLARRFGHVVGLTQHEADEARHLWTQWGAPDTQFRVVPNGVHLHEFDHLDGGEAFRAQYGLVDAVVCLFLGRLHPRKGAQVLAQAFQQVDLPGARLVIAGPDEGALALIQPYLDQRVVLAGYLDQAQRLAALAAADVFALPAVGEGLSMALLEAMAARLPVLISPGCHLPEAVEHGAGLETPVEPDALAAALRRLLADAALRDQMGHAARRLVETRFTWDAAAQALEAVYDEVTGG